jgi:hypothetical protein
MSRLLDRRNQDDIDEQETPHDDAHDAHRLCRNGKEDESEEQVGQGDAGVAKGEEARAARVEAGQRDKLRDELNHPPDERGQRQEDGQVPQEPDGPQVVRRDGWVVGAEVVRRLEAVRQQARVLVRGAAVVLGGASRWPVGAVAVVLAILVLFGSPEVGHCGYVLSPEGVYCRWCVYIVDNNIAIIISTSKVSSTLN